MLYLIAIFCSPLALLLAGRPIQALFNLILWVLSIAFTVTIILHGIGFFLWGVAFLHAALVISDANEDRRARRVINAMRRDERG